MAVKFIPRPFASALLARTPAMAAAMLDRASDVADTAKEIGPVGATGDYVAGIRAEAGVIDGLAAARVNAWDWKSGLLEFGTSDTPTFATLRLACDANGLVLTGGRA